jgi:DNA-binding NarL/FixJ family response regulator
MQLVLIIEDHDFMAEVIESLLQKTKNIKVGARVKTAEQALELLADKVFDLAMVDVSLPQMNGIDLVAVLRERYPDLPCIMLSGHVVTQYVRDALAAGARGYLLKDDSREIVVGIESALRGEIYVSKIFSDRIQCCTPAESRSQ